MPLSLDSYKPGDWAKHFYKGFLTDITDINIYQNVQYSKPTQLQRDLYQLCITK
jgi:hypothetical protein